MEIHTPSANPPDRQTYALLRDLLPFLKPYWGRISLALLCLVAAKLAGLTVPMILKRLVDGLALPSGVDALPLVLPVGLLLAYGAARLSERVFTELRQIVFARVMARASRTVMLKVFRHLHALSLSKWNARGSSDFNLPLKACKLRAILISDHDLDIVLLIGFVPRNLE